MASIDGGGVTAEQATKISYIDGVGDTDGDADGYFDTLQFVTDDEAGLTALNGGVRVSGAGAFTGFGPNTVSILSAASAVTMNASNDEAVAVGFDVTASGLQSVSIGERGIASGEASTAIGSNGDATGTSAISIGSYYARALQNHSIAMGAWSYANGAASITIGGYSDATGTGSIAIGSDSASGAQATEAGAIAIGGDGGTAAATATAADAIAIGHDAHATTGAGAVAIGLSANATAANAWQFGVGTNSTADTLQFSGLEIKVNSANRANLGLYRTDATITSGNDIANIKVGGTGGTNSGAGVDNTAQILFEATENWSDGNAGTNVVIKTTPNASETSATALTIGQDKSLKAEGAFGMAGVTPASQAAHIANPTDLAECITAINALLVVVENLGATATS